MYGPSTDSLTRGIAWKTCTRERWDLDRHYDIVANGYHRMSCWLGLYGLVIDLDLHDTLEYE
jgi:hypothetical protein